MFSGICTKPLVRAAALIPALLVFAIGIGAGHSTPLSDNDEVRESVVRVEVDKGKVVMQGTGFILNDRGYVATNHHVIENAKTIFLISCRRQADRRAGSGRRRTETTPAMASSNSTTSRASATAGRERAAFR
jgi:S1-C subfamily serine protease